MAETTLGLLGLYRCGNLGDEAIWRAFVDGIRDVSPTLHLRMVTYGPGGFDAAWIPDDPVAADGVLHQLALDARHARRFDWMYWLPVGVVRFLRELAGTQALWYAGGHWIHDLSLTTLAGILAPIVWSRWRGRSAGFVNVGVGPLATAAGRRLARHGLHGVEPLVVRDEHSAKVLRGAGVRQSASVAADTAHLLDPAPPELIEEAWTQLVGSEQRPVVGLVPCAWFKLADLYRPDTRLVDTMIASLADLVRRLEAAGHAVVLLPTMLPEDEIVAHRIASRADDLPRVAPIRDWPARTLLGVIGRLRALVSFRMHPVLFANRMRTPFVALDYAPKVRSLVADLGLSRWLVPLDDNWPAAMTEKVEQLLADPDPFAGATDLEALRERARAGIIAALATLPD
ncbi:MAG: polysaccharide pyruvyl transferase family protein [Candidatus Lernaella stagnicola]|nr:polysaccharide pyruvyl transferase family protein [Candidatus Lernaella stagnicola]